VETDLMLSAAGGRGAAGRDRIGPLSAVAFMGRYAPNAPQREQPPAPDSAAAFP